MDKDWNWAKKDEAKELDFTIRDGSGELLIRRTVRFPYVISMERIDREIAEIFLRVAEEKRNEG